MTDLKLAEPVQVMIIDDHPTVREGLRLHLSSQPNMEVCGEAATISEALEKIELRKPDVVILDLALKEGDGVQLLKELKRRFSDVQIVVHSMHEETLYAERCLKAGASGYVNKQEEPTVVLTAIRTVLDGDIHLSSKMKAHFLTRTLGGRVRPDTDPVADLTDRQLQVFRKIGEGLTATQIAKELQLSVHTVESHREHIKRKLGATSVPDLTRRAVQWVLENCR